MKRNSIKLDRLAKVAGLRVLGNDSANPGEIVALTVAELDAMGVGAGGGQPADATLTALAALDSAAGVLYQTGADAFAKYTASQVLDLISSTRGSVLYRGASGWAALAPGTDGHVLKSGGAGADPSWAANAGGWTYVKLASDFSMSSSATPSNVTGLSFTPAANTSYIIEGLFLVSTTVATNGVRPGVSWPTGLSGYGAGQIRVTHSVAGDTHGGDSQLSDFSAPASGQPGTESEAFLARMEALMTTGASPSGNFQVTLRSEGTGATHYMRATSFIRYRTH